MQRIERYGVLALVFLLVTIVTFALWDDGSKPGEVQPLDTEVATARAGAQGQGPTRRADRRNRQSSTDSMRRQREEQRQRQLADAQHRAGEKNLSKAYADDKSAASLADKTGNASAGSGFAKTGPSAKKSAAVPVKHSLELGQQQDSNSAAAHTARELHAAQLAAEKRKRDREKKDALLRGGGTRQHFVASGETLGQISVKYYGTSKHWPEIASANSDVNPKALSVGQRLVIPAVGTSVARPVAQPVAKGGNRRQQVSGPGGSYTVQAGDVLSRIAQNEVGSVVDMKRIVAMNPGLDANRLVIGQVLALPKRSAATSATRATSGTSVASATPPASRKANRDDRPRVR